MGGGITYISDGGWDHNPRNSQVRFGLTLEHLENKLLYTNASVRAAGMSSYNEAERVNGAETCAAQKVNLQGAVFLAEDESLPPNEALSLRRRRFQPVLTHALSGAVYAKQHITSLASHPGVERSELYTTHFRLECRAIMDGSTLEIPLDTRLHIRNVLRYQELHSAAGYYDFQLRRSACKKALGRLCCETDYPSPPVLEPCQPLESILHDVCEFLDDSTLGHDGHFLSATELQEKKDRENVVVLKNDPPSVPCKLLFKKTANPSDDEMR